MSALERVLVATDLSPNAARALARVALLPLADGAKVRILHVVPSGAVPPGREQTSRAREALDAVEQGLAKKIGAAVSSQVVVGEPFVEIIRAARKLRAQLVVLGRHAKKKRELLRIGRTAERVVRNGSTPTLVVQPIPARPYERPIVAVDLSDVTPTILELATTVLGEGAPLRLVHAYHVPFEGFIGMSVSRSELEDFRTEYRDDAHAALQRALAARPDEGRRWRMSLRPGEPSTVIVRELAKRDADVVVLGTHGRSGLSHLLIGSVAETVLREAACDVLVGRPERFTFELP